MKLRVVAGSGLVRAQDFWFVTASLLSAAQPKDSLAAADFEVGY